MSTSLSLYMRAADRPKFSRYLSAGLPSASQRTPRQSTARTAGGPAAVPQGLGPFSHTGDHAQKPGALTQGGELQPHALQGLPDRQSLHLPPRLRQEETS